MTTIYQILGIACFDSNTKEFVSFNLKNHKEGSLETNPFALDDFEEFRNHTKFSDPESQNLEAYTLYS